MDSRLSTVGGSRLVPLMYSDAPRVAQAIVDAKNGIAKILLGKFGDIPYVEFIRKNSYTVIIRGDDWQKIFPFFRYSSNSYSPVDPPVDPPEPIMSPQPNRTMQPPPVNPAGGLNSFLDGMPYADYRKIQNLLTVLSTNDMERKGLSFLPSNPDLEDPNYWVFPEHRVDLTYDDRLLYDRLVYVLRQLFPANFPS